MIQQSDLTEARLWDESVCLDCGETVANNDWLAESPREVLNCPVCNSTDIYAVSAIDAILEKVERAEEEP